MQKLSALLLTLVFALSLVACKKDNTSSDSSSLSTFPSQAEQNETDISAEQTSEITSEIETESKTETGSSGITSDKKGNTSTSSSKQNSSSQPTQPTRPTKLNPQTNFKFGQYVAKFFGNNNQSYHIVSLEFHQDYEGVEYIRDNFYTKDYLKKWYLEPGETFDEQSFEPDSKITLNGIPYYNIGDYGMITERYLITDKVIKVNEGDAWDELSLNADGTLVLETNGGVIYAKIGTIFTIVE